MDIVKKIEGEGSGSGKTRSTITIADSGVWQVAPFSRSARGLGLTSPAPLQLNCLWPSQ